MSQPTSPIFIRIWEFIPAPGREEAFERIYGPDGAWAQLFGLALGYLGTDLERLEDGAYRTTDRWEAEAAWIVFRQKHAAEYEGLDQQCEELTISERMVFEGDG